jgi:hypothetical protein
VAASVGPGLYTIKVAGEIPKGQVPHLSHESSLLGDARLLECCVAAESRLDCEAVAFLNRASDECLEFVVNNLANLVRDADIRAAV